MMPDRAAAGVTPSGRWIRALRFFIDPPQDRCELCRRPIPETHEHLIRLPMRRLVCACRACTESVAGEGAGPRYRHVISRGRKLHDFVLDDDGWRALGVPVELVFFIRDDAGGRPIALYPGPAGIVESAVDSEAWADLVAANPWLGDLNPETDALLVNRRSSKRDYYRLSTDYCYALCGLMRTHWQGISGGAEAGSALDEYFSKLDAGSCHA